MYYRNLQLQEWKSFSEAQAIYYAKKLANYLPQDIKFMGISSHSYCHQKNLIAHFEYAGSLFSLIPGAEVQIGYDAERFCPTKEQLSSFKDTAEEYGIEEDITTYVQSITTPLRNVTILPLLVEIQPQEIGLEPISHTEPEIQNLLKQHPDSRIIEVNNKCRVERVKDGAVSAWQIVNKTHSDITAEIASQGLRLLTSDEWEYICGAGEKTLFRWGDACPCDRYPTDNTPKERRRRTEWALSGGKIPFELDEPDWDFHLVPNLFGLKIAQNPYVWEIVAEENVVRGGDGGCNICGGVGFFMGWLPLATAYWDQSITEWLDEGDLSDSFVRRVIPIP